MNWVQIIWSMLASACLTLAAVHLTVWFKKRTAWADLAVSTMAAATAAMAAGELWIMQSAAPEQIALAMRWYHVAIWATIISIVMFIRHRLRAGRPWLAWTVVFLRTSALLLNFLFRPNLSFRALTGLGKVRFLGESLPYPVGSPNPWMLLGQLGTLLMLVFIADAAISAWRRGDKRSAVSVGGSTFFFGLAAFVNSVLVQWQVAAVPLLNSVFSVGIFLTMGYEVMREALRSGRLADDLLESEARFRGIFEDSVVGIYRVSLEGRLLTANPALARMLGYDSVDDFLSSVKDLSAQIWPSQEENSRFIRLLDDQGSVQGYECRFRRKDGSLIWVSLSTRPHRGPDGRLAYGDGFVENIEKRKWADLALAESEKRYRTLFEIAPAGIAMVGADRLVRMANSLQAHLYGYDSPQQLDGFYSPLFFAEKDRERAARDMTALLQGKKTADRIYTAVRRDGSEFTVEVTAEVLRGPARQVLGLIFLTRDITKSQEDENERIRLRNELTHLTRVLTVDQISTSLAHEINQPLGAILNNAETARILLSQPRNRQDAIPEIVEDIIQDAKRAGDIVRKVRSVLKKDDARFESLSVNDLIDETMGILSNNLALNDIVLRCDLTPELPRIRGDRIRLQQVLMNLVANAVDSMRGSPARTLTVRSAMNGQAAVTVTVGDTGSGVAEATRAHLFQPYFTTKKTGLGLGLSICRSIIDEHGGRIWADDNPGGGASFSFALAALPAKSD